MHRIRNIAELISKVGNGANSGYRWHNLLLNSVYHNYGIYYDKLQGGRIQGDGVVSVVAAAYPKFKPERFPLPCL